jgi:hypothetical protein
MSNSRKDKWSTWYYFPLPGRFLPPHPLPGDFFMAVIVMMLLLQQANGPQREIRGRESHTEDK